MKDPENGSLGGANGKSNESAVEVPSQASHAEKRHSIGGASASVRPDGHWREWGPKTLLAEVLWHGGSATDAWLMCASHQVAQVLLTLPYSFSQLGVASGICFQLFYGFVGCWTCYCITVLYAEHRQLQEKQGIRLKNHTVQWFEVLDNLLGRPWKYAGISFNCLFQICVATIQIIACGSTVYLINDSLDKRTWTYVFGAGCMLSVLIPSMHNFRVWSFIGLLMTTYTAWYMTIAAALHSQIPAPVKHTAPNHFIPYMTGATNILYTFGGHTFTVEIMDSMRKPRKLKWVYLLSTLYVFTLTLPSAISMYWRFGDKLRSIPNGLAALPRTTFRDIAVILMLTHQIFAFAVVAMPVYAVWEKVLGLHASVKNNYPLMVVARIPIGLFIWFLALAIPFFGPINSAVGAFLVTFGVYIIPAVAYNVYFWNSAARENAVEKPPLFIPSWSAIFVLNTFIAVWVLIVGFGLGSWASISNFIQLIDTFGIFASCYQCPKPNPK